MVISEAIQIPVLLWYVEVCDGHFLLLPDRLLCLLQQLRLRPCAPVVH